MTSQTLLAPRALSFGAALLFISTLASAGALTLSGTNEVPPVQTAASGSGTITVADDGAVSGSVKTTGIAGSAAHIHQGAVGKNGPVVIVLTKAGDSEWAVPAGAKLSAEQLKSFKSGELYVNVHSEANKSGEIRGQLAP